MIIIKKIKKNYINYNENYNFELTFYKNCEFS